MALKYQRSILLGSRSPRRKTRLVVGPAWNFYPRPYYASAPRTVVIQQAPPVTVIQSAPPVTEVQPPAPAPETPVIYYCRATGTNYPETMTCPGGWSTMTANTPPQPYSAGT